MKRILLLLLLIIFVLDQCLIGFHLGLEFRFLTKTLLLPLLIAYYISSVQHTNKLFLAGLIMSFFGDLFLLFSWGFILGLGSFLIAHILYILSFKAYFQKKYLAVIPIILIFILSLIGFLYPHLNELKIPVILYAFTIGTMLYVALGTKDKYLIIGALLFVVSDSILAINIFYKQSILSGMAVMLTYVIAQFLLVEGMITLNKKIQ